MQMNKLVATPLTALPQTMDNINIEILNELTNGQVNVRVADNNPHGRYPKPRQWLDWFARRRLNRMYEGGQRRYVEALLNKSESQTDSEHSQSV